MNTRRFLTVASLWVFSFAGCATAPTEVRRLSPVPENWKLPAQCQLVSILPGSPADRAGLKAGDRIDSINGAKPADAAAVAEMVNKSSSDMSAGIMDSSGTLRNLQIHLNNTRPRLGAVCDLTGWRKPGVTSVGNESVTIFEGPFAFTGSGIIDKGLVFFRARLTNDSDHALKVGPDLFSALDGNHQTLKVLSPQEVMCYLYGDKGAHLLALKKRKKETMDADTSPKSESPIEETCAGGSAAGRLSGASLEFAETNAEYVALESLWPASYPPGGTADGLIYMIEPPALPVTIQVSVEGHSMTASFGKPQPDKQAMKESELVQFFSAQPRGANLRLTLKKGKVFVGRFSSYDPDNERVWFNTPVGGLLNSASFDVPGIRSAEVMEQVPAKPEPTSGPIN